MKSYSKFIGIDIGKFSFFIAQYGSKSIREYENNAEGINQFLKEFKDALPQSLCILEPTGGHEMDLLYALCDKGFAVHRANTRKIKNFVRSHSNGAKTDKLDAMHLALYGYERNQTLSVFRPESENAIHLYELMQRRRDLKQMLVAEKNRFKSPRIDHIKSSIKAVIDILSEEVDKITEEMNSLIEGDLLLREKRRILKEIPGIGTIVANELLVCMPELGKLSRREIASLAGLAPIARDSGKSKGYRSTGHGRCGVKPMLFLASMAARNSNSRLKVFYEDLVGRGKNKMVALTALMRKILVIANAKLKTFATT